MSITRKDDMKDVNKKRNQKGKYLGQFKMQKTVENQFKNHIEYRQNE
jgi:hypothetical protein